MADLAVIILTHNEAAHIGRAISNVAPICREIFVVDSFSSDATVDIARAAGATVLQHAFINQAKQLQWALDFAPIRSGWVMRLDADEVIEADLRDEIRARLPALSADVAGVNLKRKHIFLGRWIRHGGRWPLILLRIWRRGQARVEDRWMDEHIVVSGGKTVTFASSFADHNLGDLSFFIDKHNKYATREAVEVLLRRIEPRSHTVELSAAGSSWQAASKRFMKEMIYNHIPLECGALLYFNYRYFLQLGFLDGRPGLIYHFLQGFWYRFLVAAKVQELELSLAAFENVAETKRELARLTGLKID